MPRQHSPTAGPQEELFNGKEAPDGTAAVNARCLVPTQSGHRLVAVAGIVLCQLRLRTTVVALLLLAAGARGWRARRLAAPPWSSSVLLS